MRSVWARRLKSAAAVLLALSALLPLSVSSCHKVEETPATAEARSDSVGTTRDSSGAVFRGGAGARAAASDSATRDSATRPVAGTRLIASEVSDSAAPPERTAGGPNEPEDYQYAWDWLAFDPPTSWFLVPFMFLWPLPLLAAQRRFPSGEARAMLALLFPLTAGFAGWWLFIYATAFSEPRIGAWTALSAHGLLLISGLFELALVILDGRRRSTAART